MKKKILISTGGSGGHVIPATVFYDQLNTDFDVLLTTDIRGSKFLNLNKYKVNIINTPQFTSNLFLLPLNLFFLFFLTIKSFFFLKKNNISILISTGGYMSLPIFFAAKIFNIKIYLYEPNMVLGRANKFFLKHSKKVFCYSNNILNFSKKYINKICVINPLLRKNFYSVKFSENSEIGEKVNLLIIGGSQGAKLFETEIKKTVLDLSKKYKLNIYQQISDENKKNLEEFYKKNNISYSLFNFEENFADFVKDINLCITRAGASTLSELTFLNIPYIAIPYALAKDDHQFQNALFYKNNNCCWMLDEKELKNNELPKYIINIVQNKEDYLNKKKNMKEFSYQNTWNNINQKLKGIINEN